MQEEKVKGQDRAKEVLEGYLVCREFRLNNWDEIANKGAKYFYGDQWSAEDKIVLQSQRRAPSVYNQIMPAVDLIVGHMIQGRVDLIAKPVDRFTDPDLADIMTACLKNIDQMNDIDFERRNQFLDGLITGVGVQEIFTDTDDDPEGVIRIRQNSPWHYYLDARFERYDYTDGKCIYKESWMSLEEIEANFGKKVSGQLPSFATLNDAEMMASYLKPSWDSESSDYGNLDGGAIDDERILFKHGFDRKNKLFRVIEEYVREVKQIKAYYDIETRKLINLDDMSDDDRELVKDLAVDRKEKRIYLTTLVADSIIAQDKIETKASEFYQLFNLYFPYFLNGKFWGVVENLFYPQDEINKRHSTIIHILNTHDDSGIWFEEGAFPPEVEAELSEHLAMTGMATKVNDGALNAGKIREKAVKDVPPTLRWIIERQSDVTKYIAGTPDNFGGIAQRQESGKAKELQVNRAAVRLTPLIDNFHKSMKLGGKAFIHWIQKFYTEERVIRVYGDEFGTNSQQIMINHPAFGKIFNDTSIGSYDITLEFEGKTQSERDRIKWLLVELSNSVPQFADIIAMHVLNYSDIPQKDAILNEFKQRQMAVMQNQQIGSPQGAIGGGRGPVQSAPRPSRGPRRMPQQLQTAG